MEDNNNKWLIIASITGALAVIIGAFGAHGLKPSLTDYELEIFNTGNEYHFYHALALGLVTLLISRGYSKYLKISFYSFLVGIIFFSGSLYLLATREILGIESWTWLGPITPIGGLLMVIGWLSIGFHAIKSRNN